MTDNTMTALDTSTLESVGLVQPEQPTTTVEPIVTNTEVTTEPTVVVTTPEPTSTVPVETPAPEVTKYVVEGIGEVSAEEIKEWRSGNLRQSDYTKKTQDLAKQREETADALEVFNYLKSNPHLLNQLKQIDETGIVNREIVDKATPENAMMKEIWFNQKTMEIDQKVANLKSKYGDVDEVALFNTAREMKTDDLEFVYKALAFDNNKVDQVSLIEKAKNELRAELEKTKQVTTTIVGTAQSAPVHKTITVSPEEARMAEGMGMTLEEYAKWRDR